MPGLTDQERRLIEETLMNGSILLPSESRIMFRALLRLDNTVTLLEAQLRVLREKYPDLMVHEEAT